MTRSFELARPEHAEAIQVMRVAASKDLFERFGSGPWGSGGRLESIERSIREADTGRESHGAMYVVLEDGMCIGSVGLATRNEDFGQGIAGKIPKRHRLMFSDSAFTRPIREPGLEPF